MPENSQRPKRPNPVVSLKAKASKTGPFYRWLRRGKAYARYRASRPHEPDFAGFSLLPGDGLFLDIGASIGQSALSFRIFKKVSPIISLEPLPEHEDDLRFVSRIIDGFSFRMFGASDMTGVRTLCVPAIGDYRLPAESALDREAVETVIERLESEGHDPRRLGIHETEVSLRRIDELGLDPQFVKIDVEGAELAVLKGMEETLQRFHPALLIEWSDSQPAVAELLDEYGYEANFYEQEKDRFVEYDGRDCRNVFYLT